MEYPTYTLTDFDFDNITFKWWHARRQHLAGFDTKLGNGMTFRWTFGSSEMLVVSYKAGPSRLPTQMVIDQSGQERLLEWMRLNAPAEYARFTEQTDLQPYEFTDTDLARTMDAWAHAREYEEVGFDIMLDSGAVFTYTFTGSGTYQIYKMSYTESDIPMGKNTLEALIDFAEVDPDEQEGLKKKLAIIEAENAPAPTTASPEELIDYLQQHMGVSKSSRASMNDIIEAWKAGVVTSEDLAEGAGRPIGLSIKVRARQNMMERASNKPDIKMPTYEEAAKKRTEE